jgi:hypothetical protein
MTNSKRAARCGESATCMLNFTLNFSMMVFLLRKHDVTPRGEESLRSVPTHSVWHQDCVAGSVLVWLTMEIARAIESWRDSSSSKRTDPLLILARALRLWLYQIMGMFEIAKDMYRMERNRTKRATFRTNTDVRTPLMRLRGTNETQKRLQDCNSIKDTGVNMGVLGDKSLRLREPLPTSHRTGRPDHCPHAPIPDKCVFA